MFGLGISDPRAANWALDPLLERDTAPIGDLPLCRALLINDANYPWLLLVPRRDATVEITDLEYVEQMQLMTEVSHAARTLKALTGCDKINIAALGNVVAQLHVHVIARSKGDAAWPKPVWNVVPAKAYHPREHDKLIATLRDKLILPQHTA